MKHGLRLVLFSETRGCQRGVKMRNHWALMVA
jgi:hypothetical protein